MNLRELLILKATGGHGGGGTLVEKTATGNPATFTTNVSKPLKSFSVSLSYTQSGSGDPSPSNVRPITGVSSFTFTHNNSAIDVVFPADPGTVYVGSLDLVSGLLTLTHQMLSTTWGAGTNSKEFTTNERRRFEFPVSCVGAGSAGSLSRSNIAPYLWEYSEDSVHFYNNNLYSYMFLPIGTSDSTELQIIGKLETPITIQLDPHSVTAIKGTNTFWTDTTGDLTIKYYDKA